MITFSSDKIAIYRASLNSYDFLQYQPGSRSWALIDAPVVDGYNAYAHHALFNRESYLKLYTTANGRHINIKVMQGILKLHVAEQWICIVELMLGSIIRNTHEKLQCNTVVNITAPNNLVMGEWRSSQVIPVATPPLLPPDIPEHHLQQYTALAHMITSVITNPLYTPSERASRIMTMHDRNLKLYLNTENTLHILPQYIVNLIAEDAQSKSEICPITMDPIQSNTSAVTSCFHVFERDAIASWRVVNLTCPVCKQHCSIANVV